MKQDLINDSINDADRERWINSDERLYTMWRCSHLSMRKFILANRTEIDLVIRKARNCKQDLIASDKA